MLPKGALLRTAARRTVLPPFPKQRRRRNAMRVMKSFSIALLACAVLCSPSLAGATVQKGSDLAVVRGQNDEVLANEIAERVRQYAFYTIYDDVEGSVHDGVVTLTGKVTMPYKASDIADLVARVPGVREVDNKISTLPVSTFDDQLRFTIASDIYRDPLFWNYAIQVNPPVHVVVEHGHVTLTGVVNSEVERRKAEMIARTTPGVFSVDNQLRLDREMRSTQ
jgi:osmotically-inducible protein OsmY